jgi:hypothetical protein
MPSQLLSPAYLKTTVDVEKRTLKTVRFCGVGLFVSLLLAELRGESKPRVPRGFFHAARGGAAAADKLAKKAGPGTRAPHTRRRRG